MKKWWLLATTILVLILAACGSETKKEVDDAPKEVVQKETEEKEDETLKTESTEQESSTEDLEPISLLEGIVYPLYYLGTDESIEDDDGFVRLDFEGFKVGFGMFLVELEPFEEFFYEYDEKEVVRALLVTTEAENTNDFDVDYNGGMTIVTDTKEQVSASMGLMSSNPIVQTYFGQVTEEGYYIIPLDDDSEPEELTVIMDGPWKVVDGAVNTDTGQLGEEQRITLKAFKE